MSGHTPGDWTAGVGDFLGKERFVVGLLGTKKLIAVLGYTGDDDEEESMANARLISATKDLLSELKAHQQALSILLDALEIDAEGTCFNFKAGDGSLIAKITFAELQSRSVAAINKATGATP